MDQISGAIVLTVVVLVLAACAAAPSVSPEANLPFTELPHEAPDLKDVTSLSDDPALAEEALAALPDGESGPVAPHARNSAARSG
jgi:hypothetical protein